MTPKQHLIELAKRAKREKYPSLPEHAISTKDYTDKTANGLTAMIIDFLEFKGHQAERINSTGRFVDTRQTVTDSLGFQKQIGSGRWIKGSTKKGTADISSTINGKSVKIEVKIGKDRLSDDQKAYCEAITRAGGIYIVARTFDGFYGDYFSIFEP